MGNSCRQFVLYALFAETLGTCVHHHDEDSIDNTFSRNQ